MHISHNPYPTYAGRTSWKLKATSGVALVFAILAGASFISIGCASAPPPPVVDLLPYRGPPVVMGFKGNIHLAIISAPTPGWVPGLDRVMDGPGARDVFISMREPNPAFLRAQVTVDQNIATSVPLAESVRVHVRTLRWDEEVDEDTPYTLAASAASMQQAPPTTPLVVPPPAETPK